MKFKEAEVAPKYVCSKDIFDVKRSDLKIFDHDDYWSRKHDNQVVRPNDINDVPPGTLANIIPRMRDNSHKLSYWHSNRVGEIEDLRTKMLLYEAAQKLNGN